MINREEYLGDGLYVSFDGFMVTLRAPRENGDHWVGMEPDVLESFERYVTRLLTFIKTQKALANE